MKSKFTALILVASLLTACGGGGGGGDDGKKNTTSSTTTNSSAATTSITANAGADITVNEGEKVTLNPGVEVANQLGFTSNTTTGFFEVTGSSTKASDITKLKWTQMAGTPRTGFSFSGSPGEIFSFVAPDTGAADSIQIIYELTLTNAAGQTASDSIAITVNRVNELPVANAGVDQSTESETEILLSGTASNDPDGTIQSYAWVQTSGDEVELTDADKATATFTAPVITEATTYEFELTVTDNNDATAKDKIVITLTPKDAPLVNIYFPTPVGVYKETTISAFGSAEAVSGNLHKVEVSTGSDFTEVEFNEQGEWRLDDIAVPETDTFEIIVKVTDSLGVSNIKKSVLKRSGSVSSGLPWMIGSALGINNETNQILLKAVIENTNASGIYPVDMKTGTFGPVISDFSDETQGIFPDVRRIRYDAHTNSFYATLFPANEELKTSIVSIDAITGKRKIISDSTLGTGPILENPVGIISTHNGDLLVADSDAGSVVRVNIETGDRSTMLKTAIPLDIAMDPFNTNILFSLRGSKSQVWKYLLNTTPVQYSLLSKNEEEDPFPALSVEADIQVGKLFLIELDKDLIEVNIETGERTNIPVSVETATYDHQRSLLYYVEMDNSYNSAIWVMDPVSRNRIMISESL